MKGNFLFISIDKAKRICDKAQYNEASWWEKFQLRFRFCWCKLTRQYINLNTQLTKKIENVELDCLTPEEMYEIKSKFSEQLKNHY